MTGRRLTLPEQAAAYVIESGPPLMSTPVREDNRTTPTRFLGDATAVAAVPLMAQHRCVGVL